MPTLVETINDNTSNQQEIESQKLNESEPQLQINHQEKTEQSEKNEKDSLSNGENNVSLSYSSPSHPLQDQQSEQPQIEQPNEEIESMIVSTDTEADQIGNQIADNPSQQ